MANLSYSKYSIITKEMVDVFLSELNENSWNIWEFFRNQDNFMKPGEYM